MDYNITVPLYSKESKKKGSKNKKIFEDLDPTNIIIKNYIKSIEPNAKVGRQKELFKQLNKQLRSYFKDLLSVTYTNIEGLEFPNKLGYLMIGGFQSKNTKAINWIETNKLKKQGINKIIYHPNIQTNGKAFMFIYKKINKLNIKTRLSGLRKTMFENSDYWDFKRSRRLGKEFFEYLVSKDYKVNYMPTTEILNNSL